MKKVLRFASLAVFAFALTSTAGVSPAFAYFHHYHHASKKHHTHHKHKKTSALVRDAQTSLINLDYLKGHADGVLGPKTKKAIMAFQRDHGLRVTGQLTHETYNAIIKADRSRAMSSLPLPTNLLPVSPLAQQALPLDQQTLVGPTNPQFADPMRGGQNMTSDVPGAFPTHTKELSSRYAKLKLTEVVNGTQRRYDVSVNEIPILQIDSQPSVIGASETYALDNEDAVIFTTYNNGDTVCPYKYFILSLAEGRNELHALGNCTHGYQARKVEDSLFITFPEVDDQRVAGATWRYEAGDLERL